MSAVVLVGGKVLGSSGNVFNVGSGGGGGAAWQTLKVGGGGFVRGMNIASDGTMVTRTDTNGAFLYSGTQWNQLFNASSMPGSYLNNLTLTIDYNQGGCFEIQIAPSNTQILYGVYEGYVWVSSNQGATWTKTAFTQNLTGMLPNDSYGQYGQRMAIDPQNSNIVFVGTENNGLWYTTNGGTSWTQVSTSSIPVGTGAGITGILFDPSSGVVGGAKQGIYAASSSIGVYHSTNGGSTWALTSSGPTSVVNAAIDTSGNYYAVGNAGAGIWKYTGTWTEVFTGSSPQAIAINPFNQSIVVAVSQGGQVNISYNAGSSWSGQNNNTTLVSTDIPWLYQANQSNPVGSGQYLDAGGLAFSPVTNGLLIQSAGTGTWQMSVPLSGGTSSTALTWTDFTPAIEQLVSNEIVIPPVSGSVPVLACWDRPFFFLSSLASYPSTYGPINSDTIQMGWSIDYASSNPAYVFGLSTYNNNQSGYTSNNGATWTIFSSAYQPGGTYGGTIAASTPTNIILAPSGGVQPGYTTNGGSSWTGITLPGVSSWSGFQASYAYKQRAVTADRVSANTFYLYFPGNGVYTSTNSGVTWTKQYSGYIESNSSWAGVHSKIMSVPGNAGHLFYTSGNVGGQTQTSNQSVPFYRSTNSGVNWSSVSGILGVQAFAFGAVAPTYTYPSIYVIGYVGTVFGVYVSLDDAVTWTYLGNPNAANSTLQWICSIAADPNNFGYVYVGTTGGGFMYYNG